MSIENNTNFSIIIPTYKEAKNISALAKRIDQANLNLNSFEVILVDDNSQDGTMELVENLRLHYPWLRLVTRYGTRSLSQSIIDGCRNAVNPLLVTMDADLSHPPEKIPLMLAMLSEPGVDVVIGSRYIPGGSTDVSWPLSRKIISRASARLARFLLTAPIADPLSGFLAIRKNKVFSGAKLNAIGWKIGLEIMVKCACKNIKETPIHFTQRHEGYSKLNFKIGLAYLYHVMKLAFFKVFSR